MKELTEEEKASVLLDLVDGDLDFYDEISGRYFISSFRTFWGIIGELQCKNIFRPVTLNDWFNAIGLNPLEIGDDLGWKTFEPPTMEATENSEGEMFMKVYFEKKPEIV